MALWLLPAVKEGGALCQNHEKIQKAEYLGKGRDREKTNVISISTQTRMGKGTFYMQTICPN